MTAIPIFRAAHLLPYLAFLQEHGTPVTRELRRVKLPTEIPEEPDWYLPKLPALAFLENISLREGIDECGLRAAHYQHTNPLTGELLSHILAAPTLKRALEIFACLIRIEDVSVKLWLAYEPDNVRICIHDGTPKVTATSMRVQDWTDLTVFLMTIRLFAGHQWYPKHMGLAANVALHDYAYAQFPNTELHINQHYSWIEIPYSLLALPPIGRPDEKSNNSFENDFEINLSTTLKQLIKSYLHDDSLSITTLAEISGMSLRSLQRRLSESGTSYSELLEQARIDTCMEMLVCSEAKIIDVAYAMGYSDPSHFSRAFRRITGISPRDYRKKVNHSF